MRGMVDASSSCSGALVARRRAPARSGAPRAAFAARDRRRRRSPAGASARPGGARAGRSWSPSAAISSRVAAREPRGRVVLGDVGRVAAHPLDRPERGGGEEPGAHGGERRRPAIRRRAARRDPADRDVGRLERRRPDDHPVIVGIHGPRQDPVRLSLASERPLLGDRRRARPVSDRGLDDRCRAGFPRGGEHPPGGSSTCATTSLVGEPGLALRTRHPAGSAGGRGRAAAWASVRGRASRPARAERADEEEPADRHEQQSDDGHATPREADPDRHRSAAESGSRSR